MSHYIEVIGVDELEDGEMREVEIDDHLVLVAKVGPQVYVTDARCPHIHAHLAKGTLEGTILTCPLHGSQFDVRDGSVVRWTQFGGVVKTMAEFTRHPRPLRVYDVIVEDGMIHVGEQKPPPA